jgi:hypothetical protein
MNDSALSLIHSLRLDPFPAPDYRVCHTNNDLGDYFNDFYVGGTKEDEPLIVAEDTESLPDDSPYCLTFSHTPGTGRLIYTSDYSLISLYRLNVINAFDPIQIFHNYLHDVTIFDTLSLPVPHFYDTMLMAYELCLGGGGDDDDDGMAGRGSLSLKQLSYRYLNMTMTSFSDTVYPHSIPKLREYLEETLPLIQPPSFTPTCICGHAISAHEKRGKTLRPIGKCPLCPCKKSKVRPLPPTSEEDRLLRFLRRKVEKLLHDTEQTSVDYDADNGDESPDPWKRISQWHPHDHDFLTSISGPIPRPSIADVPEPELLSYACRDSDATLRLFHYLSSLMKPSNGPWLFYR